MALCSHFVEAGVLWMAGISESGSCGMRDCHVRFVGMAAEGTFDPLGPS